MRENTTIQKLTLALLCLSLCSARIARADDGDQPVQNTVSGFFHRMFGLNHSHPANHFDDRSSDDSNEETPTPSPTVAPTPKIAPTPVAVATPTPAAAAPTVAPAYIPRPLPNEPTPPPASAIQNAGSVYHYTATSEHAHQWYAVLFGGVDDPNPARNIFQQSMTDLGRSLTTNGWNVDVLFGSHYACSNCGTSPWSVDPIAEAIGKSPAAIRKASKLELLRKLDFAIANLQSGDQFYLGINTHGVGTFWHSQQTVSLAVYEESDPNTLHNSSLYITDPDLLSRLSTLKQHGVKVAIGNDSCFSGYTIKVFEPYGCVLTQTSESKYGLGNPVSDSITSLLTANPNDVGAVALNHNGTVTMEDAFFGTTTWATNGINSPYYSTPFVGVLEPQFSAFLGSYSAVETLSQKWLIKLPSRELVLQGDQLLYTGHANDFSEFQDFVQQFILPHLNASKDDTYQKLAAYFLKSKLGILGGFNVESPTQLVKSVMGATADYRKAANDYQTASASIARIQNSIAASGLNTSIQLQGQDAAAQGAFEAALQKAGTPVVVSYLGSDRAGSNVWISSSMTANGTTQRFFAPGSTWYKSSVSSAVTFLTMEMAKTYPAAQTQGFRDRLSATIVEAQTAAWNAASADAQANLQQIERLGKLQDFKTQLVKFGDTTRFIQYAIEARMFAYVFHHNEAHGRDVDVDACRDFTLRNIQ